MPIITDMALDSLDPGLVREGEPTLLRRYLSVTFDDGFCAEFWPTRYRPGDKPVQLGQYILFYHENHISTYNGFLASHGSTALDHQLIFCETGYTPQQIADYWQTCINEVTNGRFGVKYWNGTNFPIKILTSDLPGLSQLLSA